MYNIVSSVCTLAALVYTLPNVKIFVEINNVM